MSSSVDTAAPVKRRGPYGPERRARHAEGALRSWDDPDKRARRAAAQQRRQADPRLFAQALQTLMRTWYRKMLRQGLTAAEFEAAVQTALSHVVAEG